MYYIYIHILYILYYIYIIYILYYIYIYYNILYISYICIQIYNIYIYTYIYRAKPSNNQTECEVDGKICQNIKPLTPTHIPSSVQVSTWGRLED